MTLEKKRWEFLERQITQERAQRPQAFVSVAWAYSEGLPVGRS